MHLRTVIIDDEQKGINTLNMLIEKYVPDVKVIANNTRAEEGIESIEDFMPDVVFLDINMPRMNGFELLEKLRWKDFSLVFTTAHREYGLKALKSDAIDYLLKPIDPKDLCMAVERIKSRRNEKHLAASFNYKELQDVFNQAYKQRITIHSKSGVESIDLANIARLESRSNYTMIYLADGRIIMAAKTLKEFDMQLCTPGSDFMRVHQSFIINLNKVSRFLKTTENIVMNDEQKVPVSRSRKDIFLKWLGI